MSLMLHTSRSPDTSEIKYIHNRQTIHPHEENVWTNITRRHIKQKASFFFFAIITKSIWWCQMHKHRTNRIQLQNSSENSLTDEFKRNWIAFTYMSSASEGGLLLIYCSGSFSFPRACRKKPRESEIRCKPVENKPHKNIVIGSLCKVSRLQLKWQDYE